MNLYRSIYSLVFTVVLLLFTSCNENSFTTIVDIDVADHEPLLSVTSRLIIDNDIVGLKVATVRSSRGINSAQKNWDVLDAKVSLFENGALVDEGSEFFIKSWPDAPDSSLFYAFEYKDFKSGSEYKMTVEKEGFPSVSATQILLQSDSISKLVFTKLGKILPDGGDADEFNIQLANPSDDKYYLIEGYYGLKTNDNDSLYSERQRIYFDSDNPLYRRTDQGLLLRGSDIADEQNEINVYNGSGTYYQRNQDDKVKLSISLSTITREYYLFLLSYSQYSNSQGNPFAEPSEVYSNFENGFGIFSIEGSTSIERILN